MKTVKYLDKILEYISMLALIIMISLVFFNSLLRYFFDSGIAFSEEFSRICFVYMIFLGIILVAKDKAHLTVDIITSSLPEKYKKIVSLISNLCVLVSMIFIALGALQLMALTYTQKMPATGISSSFLYFAVVISSVSYFFIIIFSLMKDNKKPLDK
ncbi:C4-dicarboxylate ABC transporter permease [Rodentibacter pneumotropicus]|uniref:TRAP transporter small permease protein n=3 Tax=Rodentibacter pneumotropicus TaxID=758 RepID=A0AAW5LCM7_9PAST|nr:TRAP transporter small permease [Rodentibacter pneumotropicus]MCQ9121182.1 TRAP transporter small permease [Rodentibacter pneumotropicus]OOF66553.1 C4-dicarboxylate ABC transporter permease [Rodentibacter pneumotropicus]